MPHAGNPPQREDVPLPALDYRPPPRPSRFGLTIFCLSIFSLAFMATSVSMYHNALGFNHRSIQLWIAWASIALGGISAVLSPIALYFRRSLYEFCAIIFAILYWLVFILLLHA